MKKHPPKFDTLAAMKRLTEAGISTDQAEAHIETIAESAKELATKSDLEQTKKTLGAKIEQGNVKLEQVNQFLSYRLDTLETNLTKEIAAGDSRVEANLTKKIESSHSALSKEIAASVSKIEANLTKEIAASFSRVEANLTKEIVASVSRVETTLTEKIEMNFYKLLAILPAAMASLYALYSYLKDKLG